MLSRALGMNMSQMNLHFDGYPGGCVMTVALDADVKYKLLQCVTPVSDGKNVMHMLISIRKAAACRGARSTTCCSGSRPDRRRGTTSGSGTG